MTGPRLVRVPSGAPGPGGGLPDSLPGLPLPLRSYAAQTRTNRRFDGFDLSDWDRYYLPPALWNLTDDPVREHLTAIEDDNRSAIVPAPVLTLDGVPFYLSVKGVGSALDPFSGRRLDATYASELSAEPEVRRRLGLERHDALGGMITGELWLRGSPYGGQGWPHARTALAVSERADFTDLAGFRVAPVVKVATLPPAVVERIRSIHWFRSYAGEFVQEIRLVPSNVRVYFHAQSTVGLHPSHVFDRFRIDSGPRGLAFERNFVRSGIAALTLFARTAERSTGADRVTGLDFLDVWIDKDAVLGADGTLFFVDLEGIEPVSVPTADVAEKLEDQIYHSLYEFMFAYEQIEAERARRFGGSGSRKRRFEAVVLDALRDDPVARPRVSPNGLTLEIRCAGGREPLSLEFPLVDA